MTAGAIAAGLVIGACACAAPPRAPSGKPWIDMDYGPFLTASIEAPFPERNIAQKGLAIRLGETREGEPEAAVLFDTDLLRYAAGWTGGFVALKGVVFDGEHWAYPRISGEQVFGTPPIPGWSRDGAFADPRASPYGPLPRDQARWKGLYLNGERVILSYTVGDAAVLETPGIERGYGITAISRTIELGRSASDVTLEVFFDDRGKLELSPDGLVASCAAREPGVELDAGLIEKWSFEETGGDVAGPATERGHALRLHEHRRVEGREGRGIAFDGKGRAEVDVLPAVDFTKRDLTVAAWIRCERGGTIVSMTRPTGPWVPDGKAFFVRGGRLAFDVGWVGCVEGRREVADGEWHHAAMTWSASDGKARLFADGEIDGEGTVKPHGALDGERLRVGTAAPDFPEESGFRGTIDEITLHDRALGAAELRRLAGKPPRDRTTAAAIGEGVPGATWILTDPGHARLRIPAASTPARFRALVWSGAAGELPRFSALAHAARPLPALEPLTHGGPPRWNRTLVTRGTPGEGDGPYVIDTLASPDDNPWRAWMRYGGFDFFSDPSRAALSTWSGDVWIVSGIGPTLEKLAWRRIATGLYQPLGLKIVGDEIFVLGRDQITKLRDLNGDGETDFYECFNNDHQNTEHFHEFALDLQTDASGDFYYMKAARHARDALVPQHGTLIHVAKDGASSEIIANGFRAPNGLLITPAGEFFSTDQQGFWLPANRINRIAPGSFHGNVWSYHRGAKPTTYDPPLCWLHPSVDRSPSTLAWVSSKSWGPLENRLISLSYGMGAAFLVLRDSVGDAQQGAVARLPFEFDTGVHRARFHPIDGQLYVCGLYGWAGNKTRPGGFYRVRYTGKPLQLPAGFHAAADGIVLGFTDPLDPESASDAGSYSVQCWNYRWTENYGSPDFRRDGREGRDSLPVESAAVSADGRTVFLKLPGITPVMQVHVAIHVKSATGDPIRTFVHGTIHALDSEPGAARLGDGARIGRRDDGARAHGDAPGVLQSFRALDARGASTSDARPSRLIALEVAAGHPPTPFVDAGRFECVWEGFIRSEIREDRSFDVEGRGRVRVEIGGRAVIDGAGGALHAATAAPIPLEQGLTPIRVTYESPASGDAELRLYWSGGETPRGPVPPGALAHDSRSDDARARLLRRGRELFAARRCIRCHAPEAAPGEGAMPELASDAPSFDGIGSRLDERWIAEWIEHPRSSRPDALMPRMLHGSPDGRRHDATDLAAFLATLTSAPGDATRPVTTDRGEAGARGERLWSALGCFTCHSLAGDSIARSDAPIALDAVRAKWRAPALVEYLLEPQKRFHWTRMPDFRLSRPEAESLAGLLLARSPRGAAPPGPSGDAARGRELASSLGCAACHEIPGAPRTAAPLSLESLASARLDAGCLSAAEDRRGRAPDFELDPEERAALQALARDGLDSLRRTDWPELAERQIRALRCGSCHERDGKKDAWLELSPPGDVAEARGGTDPITAPTTIHRARPPLTWAGEKLRPEWIERAVAGTLFYKPRPRLEARMPSFPAYAHGVASGLSAQHGFPATTPTREGPQPSLAEVGKALAQPGGFICIQCHPTAGQAALAGPDSETIDLRRISDRLTRHFFDRFLEDPQAILPGTMMPRYTSDAGKSVLAEPFGGSAEKQFDAIWHYLRTIESAKQGEGS